MENMASVVRKNVTAIQLLLLAGGFTITLVELILMGHTKGIQLIAVGSTVFGIVLALWGLVAGNATRTIVVILFLGLSLSGLVGAFEHLEGGEDEAGEASATFQVANTNRGQIINTAFNAEEEGENGEGSEAGEAAAAEGSNEAGEGGEGGEANEGGKEGNPPPLAPLSLSGLALFGAVTLLGAKRES